jgi:hypothetical protein
MLALFTALKAHRQKSKLLGAKKIRILSSTVMNAYYMTYDDGSGKRYIDLQGYQFNMQGNPYIERWLCINPSWSRVIDQRGNS